MIVLRVHDVSGGRLVRLERFPAIVGRSVFADVVLESDTVSMRHATLDRHETGGIVVRDLGSKNGVLVERRKVAEHLFSHNGRFYVGGIELELIQREDAPEPTRVGAARLTGGGELRFGSTALRLVGLFLALCGAVVVEEFGRIWPPERPTAIITEAVGVFAMLIGFAFFASLLSKLNTRRFNYLRLLSVITFTMIWVSLYGEIDATIVYNLWREPLRQAVPILAALVPSLVFFLLLLRELFPAMPRRRRNTLGVVLVLGGFGVFRLIGHYRFEESDKRELDFVVGYPLVDPTQGAGRTASLLEKLAASTRDVEAYRAKARQERASDARSQVDK